MVAVRILITDGGKHPPEKWAEIATDDIIQIAADSTNILLKESLEFRVKLVDLFTNHFDKVMKIEQEAIANQQNHALHSEPHVQPAADAICALAVGTSFAGHFNKPEVRQYIENVCNVHFKSAMNVERLHDESSRAAEDAKIIEGPQKKKAAK